MNNNNKNESTQLNHNKQLYKYRDLYSLGYGSRSTIWRKIKSGDFPEPLSDSNGNRFWTSKMLDNYVDSLGP
jgi:predicted DNA-binding transcriptional regulator AlpA